MIIKLTKRLETAPVCHCYISINLTFQPSGSGRLKTLSELLHFSTWLISHKQRPKFLILNHRHPPDNLFPTHQSPAGLYRYPPENLSPKRYSQAGLRRHPPDNLSPTHYSPAGLYWS